MIAVFSERISYGKWFATFFFSAARLFMLATMIHLSYSLLDCCWKAFRMWEKIECIWCKKWWHTIMIVCHWNFQRDFSPCKKDAKSNLKSTCALNYSSSHLQCNALSLYLSYNILAKNVTHKMILHCERGGFHHLPFWHQTAGDKNGLR